MRTGLVSVTFRKLLPQKIIALAVQAGLNAIEWGGDVHVPHGDIDCACNVRDMMIAGGLEIAAYGSYYRVGQSEEEGLDFTNVLTTAQALGAPVIRVWVGAFGSADADQEYRRKISGELHRIGSMAQDLNIIVALEFHARSLTDTSESALQLLHDAGHPNVKTYWQPPVGRLLEENCADLRMLRDYLVNLHVHHFDPVTRKQQALASGRADWSKYLEIASAAPKSPRYALLEFVMDGTEQQFLDDVAVLRELV